MNFNRHKFQRGKSPDKISVDLAGQAQLTVGTRPSFIPMSCLCREKLKGAVAGKNASIQFQTPC